MERIVGLKTLIMSFMSKKSINNKDNNYKYNYDAISNRKLRQNSFRMEFYERTKNKRWNLGAATWTYYIGDIAVKIALTPR